MATDWPWSRSNNKVKVMACYQIWMFCHQYYKVQSVLLVIQKIRASLKFLGQMDGLMSLNCPPTFTKMLGTKNWRVCMYASRFLLFRSTLPDPRGTWQVLTKPHYISGEGGSEAFTVRINVRFPSTYVYRWRTGRWNTAPWLKIHANFTTPRHQNYRDLPEVHDHDRNYHWKGYQSIKWRPWNQAVFRWTKNRSARRKNHRISQGNGREPHPNIIDRAESRWPESQRRHGVSDQINQRLVSP